MEIQILNLINQHLHGSEIVNHLAKFISIISDNGYIWLALGLFLMIFKKTRKAGFITLCGVAATLLFNSIILKNIFVRARPFIEEPNLATFIKSIGMDLPDSNSFPSGHTFVSFCCSIILCLQLKGKWPFIYIFASAVALSRIFLCVHYPTDVLAGAVIGTAVGVGVYFVMNYILKKLDNFILLKRKQKRSITENNVSQNKSTEHENDPTDLETKEEE